MHVVRNLPEQLIIEHNPTAIRVTIGIAFVLALVMTLGNFLHDGMRCEYSPSECDFMGSQVFGAISIGSVVAWLLLVPPVQVVFDHGEATVKIRWKYLFKRATWTFKTSQICDVETTPSKRMRHEHQIFLVVDEAGAQTRVPLTKNPVLQSGVQICADTIRAWLADHRENSASNQHDV